MTPIHEILISPFAGLHWDSAGLYCWTRFLTSSSEIDVELVRLSASSCAPVDELVGADAALYCELGSEQVILQEYIVILLVELMLLRENPYSDWQN